MQVALRHITQAQQYYLYMGIIPADTKIQAAVTAKAGENYTGTAKGIYRIIKSDIKNVKVSIPVQTYTGKGRYCCDRWWHEDCRVGV